MKKIKIYFMNHIKTLTDNINDAKVFQNIELNKLKTYTTLCKKDHDSMSNEDRNKFFFNLDKRIRNLDKRINQVSLFLFENDTQITIVNHTGLYKKENRILTRFGISIYFKDEDKVSNVFDAIGASTGLEILDTNLDSIIEDMVKTGIDKLYAKPCIGREMPVIIGPAFGAVIFHEACGHAMEATSVAKNLSVLCGKLNTKIASDKATIIDDGTIENLWGTTNIDDEGNETRKNILIENGILKNYFIEKLNSI